MRWSEKKLLSQECSIARRLFSAPLVKQDKWIPSTRKFPQRRWNNRPGVSLEKWRFPSWQKLSLPRWCPKPQMSRKSSISQVINQSSMYRPSESVQMESCAAGVSSTWMELQKRFLPRWIMCWLPVTWQACFSILYRH